MRDFPIVFFPCFASRLPSDFQPEFSRHSRLKAAALFVCSLGLLSLAVAQGPPEKEPQPQQNGMSAGVAHAAVKDAQSRPITAGGFVDGAPIVFADVTHSAGLDK